MSKISICFIVSFAFVAIFLPQSSGNLILGNSIVNVDCLLDRVTKVCGNLLGTIAKLLKSVDSLLDKLLGCVLNDLLGGLLNAVSDLLGNLLGGLLGSGKKDGKDGEKSDGLLDAIGNILDGLLKGLGPLLDAILKLVANLLKLIGRLLGRKGLLEEICGTSEHLIKETLIKISELTKGIEKDPHVISIVQCATSELTYCTNTLLLSVSSEMGLVEGLLDTVVKLVTGLVSSLGKCLGGELGNLGNCLTDLLGEVTKALDSIANLLGLDDAKPVSGLLTEVNCCINNALFNLISSLGSLGICNEIPKLCCEDKK